VGVWECGLWSLAPGNIASEGGLSDADVLGDSRDGPVFYSVIGDGCSVRNVFGEGDINYRGVFHGGLIKAGVQLRKPLICLMARLTPHKVSWGSTRKTPDMLATGPIARPEQALSGVSALKNAG